MNNKIYTITCISENGINIRCFGYFFNYEEAKEKVLRSRADLQENLYYYCVIEEFAPGILSMSNQLTWFRFEFEDNRWIPLFSAPEKFEGVANFAIN